GTVVNLTFIPSFTCSGLGSTFTTLPRTLVPSQSTTDAPNGTGIPGAANDTIVNARTSPSEATRTLANSVPPHAAQALRLSKNRAPHPAHSCATKYGSPSPNPR